MKCPHCGKKISVAFAAAEAGREFQALRKTFGAGPGRPKAKRRCKCGAMTRERAKKRGHKC